MLKKIIFNRITFAFFALAAIVLISFPIIKNNRQRYQINKEVKELKYEIKAIEEKNTELSKLLDYLQSDQFVEEQARLNFGLKKEGEEVAVIKDNNESDNIGLNNGSGPVQADNSGKTIYNIPGLNNNTLPKKITNPERWRMYFFNNN
ncbi:hypothetical protein CO115_02820 [Candidatus Falkowbacteria bacterium CG_4_9_14_3_um_filter_36_9]|uniref:Cell division protein FtsL n=2 Tax=Candidatus Falkowiibacteriota TaxID=1752728 RepID=A0A1J4TBQ7_9BACT|nr:MAG: hypothetical protein AUJ27_00930 [Candidatus Falkowbacteria bacterium CG1_02_37_44]PIV50880.1 MAG: hypothetical protein COS18_03805 [Candidatus Falkowbacteria bacterium CG02_land_8_20_14_3_00_36_14]PIX11501.1 MAG: hypothetical protein COZ73_02435 [Candidatus Falkowbacteria bacterium CG_4_8_14_3_um_filter_36_11]PJA10713.1 MAG: hypothetical protein COX67_03605 [Candidatus Falkowbacteria bacterium CG_4_10_14_0_2_um_filter_36_22]PJB19381.1 MAG: hypothetical protein CO115_02820 [Candidatus F